MTLDLTKFLLVLFVNAFLSNQLLAAETERELGKNNQLFDFVDKSLEIRFPEDHGAHPKFRLEWWYLTANLKDELGEDHGLQWTIFRTTLDPKTSELKNWDNSEIWMAHIASTDRSSHIVEEKFARGGISQAGIVASPFSAWIDNWTMTGPSWDNLELSVAGEKLNYYLKLNAAGPLVLHGENGFSIKSDHGHASAYYSQPFFSAQGWIQKNGKKYEVSGTAWADHEWSSQFLSDQQTGWDWFSIKFVTGERLMVFRVRKTDEKHFYSGTWITSTGTTQKLQGNDIFLKPLKKPTTKSPYVTEWLIEIRKLKISVVIEALNDKAKMTTFLPYWEGPINVSGTHEGNGYLEMTGYDGNFSVNF